MIEGLPEGYQQRLAEWSPRYLVQKAPWVGGNPIPEFEPVVVIRGQDEMALEMMDIYMARYAKKPNADPQVLVELAHHRRMLAHFAAEFPERMKTADRDAGRNGSRSERSD